MICGLSAGMVLFIAAAGLTLVLGSLEVLNIAHGSIYSIGIYLCWALTVHLGSLPGGFYVALVGAMIGAAIFGGLIEITVIRPVYKLDMIYQFITTFAVTFIVMDLLKMIWGGAYHTIGAPSYLAGSFRLFGLEIPKYNFLLIIIGFAVAVALHLFINRTRAGLIIRGITADRTMMSFLGKNVSLTYTCIFMLGCALAGFAGAAIGPITAAGPGIDVDILISSFIVIVIGGAGSLGGALIGAIALGLVNSLGILFVPKLAIGFPFFLMLIVLIARPWGLLGKPMKL
jgi:branched-subunit amino acid ABC-type transport system permease component